MIESLSPLEKSLIFRDAMDEVYDNLYDSYARFVRSSDYDLLLEA